MWWVCFGEGRQAKSWNARLENQAEEKEKIKKKNDKNSETKLRRTLKTKDLLVLRVVKTGLFLSVFGLFWANLGAKKAG